MKTMAAILLCVVCALPATADASTLAAGTYRTASGSIVYVGPEHELPDTASDQFFDPATQRYGDVAYYADTRRRAAVILSHGNDPETREMGYIIPYFVLHGIDVIAYDQRGTGQSEGSWQFSGPSQRAQDVDAIFDAFAGDPMVDAKRIGVWAFSNGGWTAPVVATQRPLAFVLLKSAPAGSIVENLTFEVRQSMLRARHPEAETQQALTTWQAILAALAGTAPWEPAERLYASAKRQSWFDDSLIPANLPLPLRGAVAQGYRNFAFYDPGDVLRRVTTPSLALYGADDRKVDATRDSRTLRKAFHAAGMTDFTMHMYPHALHTLLVTSDGFTAVEPERFARGYPVVMIDWLQQRGFLQSQ